MLFTTNPDKIRDFCKDRTALEQALCLDLSDQFRKQDLHRTITIAVNACMLFVQDLKKEQALEPIITRLEADNDFLFHTADKNVKGILANREKNIPLTPEQCGNLIRFYGEVVEACASFSIYWKEERMKQIGWRYGGGGEFFKAKLSLQKYHEDEKFQGKDVYVAKADQGSVWRKDKWLFSQKGKDGNLVPTPVKHWELKPDVQKGGVLSWQQSQIDAPDAGEGGRRRLAQKAKDKQGHKFDTYFAKAGEEKRPKPYYDMIPGNVFESEEMKKLHIGKKFGGVMEWKILDASTIGMIDRVFGLPYGADISGTTSDELYFLTGWADISSGDPLVMMLPLAVIVGEYHHTLLEVAAAMSLRKVISYSIGFYSTLLPGVPPRVKEEGREHPQRPAIKELLRKYEDDDKNRHILVYYDKNHKMAGCYIAEDEDLPAFKKLGKIDISLWPKFSKIPEYPNEDKIMGLLKDVGLGNAALAARVHALRPAA